MSNAKNTQEKLRIEDEYTRLTGLLRTEDSKEECRRIELKLSTLRKMNFQLMANPKQYFRDKKMIQGLFKS